VNATVEPQQSTTETASSSTEMAVMTAATETREISTTRSLPTTAEVTATTAALLEPPQFSLSPSQIRLQQEQEWETMKLLSREAHEQEERRKQRLSQQAAAEQQQQQQQNKKAKKKEKKKKSSKKKQEPPKQLPKLRLPQQVEQQEEDACFEVSIEEEGSTRISHHTNTNSATSLNDTTETAEVAINEEERKTIRLLRKTIEQHEDRLVQIEHVQIPMLIQQAKSYLALNNSINNKDGNKNKTSAPSKSERTRRMKSNRKEALRCMARKKRLEEAMEVSKGAIFQMETQVLLLESAMEDREVAKVMEEATQTMEALQQQQRHSSSSSTTVQYENEDELTQVLQDVSDRVEEDLWLDEEELLRELTLEEDEGEAGRNHNNDLLNGNESILSLPSVASYSVTDLPVPNEADLHNSKKGRNKKNKKEKKAIIAASWA